MRTNRWINTLCSYEEQHSAMKKGNERMITQNVNDSEKHYSEQRSHT